MGDFIPEAVQNLFAQWEKNESAPRKRKKKGGGGDGGEEEVDGAEETFNAFTPVAKKPKSAKKIATGNPSCTSEADCAGSPEDELVQHILEDGPGDIYCCTCWNSFKERNPDLEGIPVED